MKLKWLIPPVVGFVGGACVGAWPNNPSTQITFLSVGQGDCAVIQDSGRTILVDAGPAGRGADAGAKIVVPRLRAMGVERLDLILLSHPDADHVGGTGAILDAYPEAQVGISAVFKDHPKLLADLIKWRVKPEAVRWFPSRSSLSVGGTQIRVRCPDLFPGAIDNDGSMCLKLQHQTATAVFTGDAPVSVEERLATEEDWSGEVLKAGHHGSRTATGDTWVKAVHPIWAVLSCGRDNPYGHPHRDVVNRLDRAGVSILRTDLNGDIKFSISHGHFHRG